LILLILSKSVELQWTGFTGFNGLTGYTNDKHKQPAGMSLGFIKFDFNPVNLLDPVNPV
jgi:hypothetical protein